MINWGSIHCGKITKEEITKHVVDSNWQKLRLHLKGKDLGYKYFCLCNWLHDNKSSRSSQVQVTNYINALKRGGLVK